jgi:hypothetical protein
MHVFLCDVCGVCNAYVYYSYNVALCHACFVVASLINLIIHTHSCITSIPNVTSLDLDIYLHTSFNF